MRVTSTEAKNRLGTLSAQAKREPVFVEKAARIDTVIPSVDHEPVLQPSRAKAARAARKKRFESEFAEWIAAESARLEAHGISGADLRPW